MCVKRGGVTIGPLGPPIVSGPRCQTGCCLHRRRFAQERQKDPVGSCREGFCEMPSTPSTPSGTGNPLGFCSVDESAGGRGGSPGLVYLVSHLYQTGEKPRDTRTRGLPTFLEPKPKRAWAHTTLAKGLSSCIPFLCDSHGAGFNLTKP